MPKTKKEPMSQSDWEKAHPNQGYWPEENLRQLLGKNYYPGVVEDWNLNRLSPEEKSRLTGGTSYAAATSSKQPKGESPASRLSPRFEPMRGSGPINQSNYGQEIAQKEQEYKNQKKQQAPDYSPIFGRPEWDEEYFLGTPFQRASQDVGLRFAQPRRMQLIEQMMAEQNKPIAQQIFGSQLGSLLEGLAPQAISSFLQGPQSDYSGYGNQDNGLGMLLGSGLGGLLADYLGGYAPQQQQQSFSGYNQAPNMMSGNQYSMNDYGDDRDNERIQQQQAAQDYASDRSYDNAVNSALDMGQHRPSMADTAREARMEQEANRNSFDTLKPYFDELNQNRNTFRFKD